MGLAMFFYKHILRQPLGNCDVEVGERISLENIQLAMQIYPDLPVDKLFPCDSAWI